MKLKGINASSQKTIKAIKKAFAELIAEKKEITSITVTELVQKADITRGTFYAHYDNIYELSNDFQKEILNQVIGNDITISSQEDVNNYFDKLFKYLSDNQDIYYKLLASNETKIFMDLISNKILNSLAKSISSKNQLKVIFFTDGAINLIVRFFKKEIPYTLTEISNFIKTEANNIFFNN